jgi:hypothetical protein
MIVKTAVNFLSELEKTDSKITTTIVGDDGTEQKVRLDSLMQELGSYRNTKKATNAETKALHKICLLLSKRTETDDPGLAVKDILPILRHLLFETRAPGAAKEARAIANTQSKVRQMTARKIEAVKKLIDDEVEGGITQDDLDVIEYGVAFQLVDTIAYIVYNTVGTGLTTAEATDIIDKVQAAPLKNKWKNANVVSLEDFKADESVSAADKGGMDSYFAAQVRKRAQADVVAAPGQAALAEDLPDFRFG